MPFILAALDLQGIARSAEEFARPGADRFARRGRTHPKPPPTRGNRTLAALRAGFRAGPAPILPRGTGLGGTTLRDGVEPRAQVGLVLGDVVEPRQLRQALEAEHPLE